MKYFSQTTVFVATSMQHKIMVSPQTEEACNQIANVLGLPRRCQNKVPYSNLIERFPRKPWTELSWEGKRARKKRMVQIMHHLLPLLADVLSEYSLDSVADSLKGKILYKIQKQVTPAAIVALKDAARISDHVYTMFHRLLPQVLPSNRS